MASSPLSALLSTAAPHANSTSLRQDALLLSTTNYLPTVNGSVPASATQNEAHTATAPIGINGTDPFNIVADLSRSSSSFQLSIETQLFMCLLYGLLTFIAVTSNMIVCYIVLSNQRMRTATNYFIVNLAVGDILMALLCIPFTFPANLIFQYWPFGLSLCVVVSYSQANSVFISAYTMVAISIDKYLAIMYPMRLRMSKTQAKIIILVIWSAALVTSLPTALLSSIEPLSPDATNSTSFEASAPTWPTSPLLATQTLATGAALPTSRLAPAATAQQQDQVTSATQNQANRTMSSATTTNALIGDEFKSTAEATLSSSSQQQPNTGESSPMQQQGQRKYICQESWNFWPQGKYYYSMALMILQFVLPLFVLVITYSRIVIVVWGKRMPGEEDNARDARMARSKRKMIKMVIFCVIAFALTWLPFNALIVIGDMHPDIWENSSIMYIWFITHYLAMCHTITNPLIYIWMNNRFRAGFGQVIEDLYMAAKLAFIHIWFCCCCMGCCLRSSRVKQRRAVSNLRQKRYQQVQGSGTNHTPPTNIVHTNLNNTGRLQHPQVGDGSSNSGPHGKDQVEPNGAVQLRCKPTSSISTAAEQDGQGDKVKVEGAQKQRRKLFLLTGRRKRNTSIDGTPDLGSKNADEEAKRMERRKRRKRAQSHAINLCLTSTQSAASVACLACKKDQKKPVGNKGTRRPFIADMCRSSQSTATISVHTNTTSLAISPLCSRTATANTSASSGEQANDLTNKSEPTRVRHRVRRKPEHRTGSLGKVGEEGRLTGARIRKASDGVVADMKSQVSKAPMQLTEDSSSLESFNDDDPDQVDAHYCPEHSAGRQRPREATLDPRIDPYNLETTDDDVADVVFQQTGSMDSNNKRCMNVDQSDEHMADFCGEAESLEAEYGDSSLGPEFVPLVRLNVNRDRLANGEQTNGFTDRNSADKRHRMQLPKRLFRSMGDDLGGCSVVECRVECVDSGNLEEDCGRKCTLKSSIVSANKGDGDGEKAPQTNHNNYQTPITTPSGQYKTSRPDNVEQQQQQHQQRVRSLRRTMLLNNHLISSTSRIPDHLAASEVSPLVSRDVISSNETKSTPSMLKPHEKALGNPCIGQERQRRQRSSSGAMNGDFTQSLSPFAPIPTASHLPGQAHLADSARGRSGGTRKCAHTVANSDPRHHQSSSDPASSVGGTKALVLTEDGCTWLEVNRSRATNGAGRFLSQVRLEPINSTKKAYSLDAADERRRLITLSDEAKISISSTNGLPKGRSFIEPEPIESIRAALGQGHGNQMLDLSCKSPVATAMIKL